ncbi:MAG: malonic semialdehyde reductase [Polyangiaceae bacterium]
MTNLDDVSLAKIFTLARTHSAWADRPIDDAVLQRIYEIARMGPTSANTQPMRVLFAKSADSKEKLRPALSAGNVDKTMAAPVTAVVAYDPSFHTYMPKLFPSRPDMQGSFANMPAEKREFFLTQNASMQAAYLIITARAVGIDCGPMGGFDRTKVDAAFFGELGWRSILLINLGYGVPEKVFPRNPRLDFEEACRIA